jgi:hypothetical protein
MLGGIASMKDMGAALSIESHSAGLKTGAAETVLAGGDFDRLPAGGGDASAQQFESVVVLLSVSGNLSAGESLSLAIDVDDAPLAASGSGPGTYAAAPAGSQPTAAAIIDGGAGGAYKACLRYDLRVTELDRFLRFNVTPDFSLNNISETATIQVAIIAGGAHNMVTRSVDYTPSYAV